MSSIKDSLHQTAITARLKSHSPYSHFKVGAAAKFKGSDKIYSGCNVENSSYGGCVCAERVTIVKAISEMGKTELEELLVVTSSTTGDFPCGFCLQTINEFAGKSTLIHIANTKEILKSYRFSELLPFAFDSQNLPS